jgi:hypothetical protein
MVRMAMGEEDDIDFVRGNPIALHLLKKVRNMMGMTRIDQRSHLSPDHIRVAIILIRVLPNISIEVFFDLHLLSLPCRLKIPS